MPTSTVAWARLAQTSRAATSSWAPWTRQRAVGDVSARGGPPRCRAGARHHHAEAVRRAAAPWRRARPAASRRPRRSVCPDAVMPTAPGSMPPWPASRKTVRWRSPVVGGNETHAPGLNRAGATGCPSVLAGPRVNYQSASVWAANRRTELSRSSGTRSRPPPGRPTRTRANRRPAPGGGSTPRTAGVGRGRLADDRSEAARTALIVGPV